MILVSSSSQPTSYPGLILQSGVVGVRLKQLTLFAGLVLQSGDVGVFLFVAYLGDSWIDCPKR